MKLNRPDYNNIQTKANEKFGNGNAIILPFDYVLWDSITVRIIAEEAGLSADPDFTNEHHFMVLRELLDCAAEGVFPSGLNIIARHLTS